MTNVFLLLKGGESDIEKVIRHLDMTFPVIEESSIEPTNHMGEFDCKIVITLSDFQPKPTEK